MPLRDEIAEPSTQSSGLENFTATSLKTLEKSSIAFADEVTDDLLNHPAKFLERSVYGAGIGFGATWALKRPQIALIAGSGLGIWQSVQGLSAFNEYAGKAVKADTEQARERISAEAGLRLGHSMAISVEMLPAMGFGAYQGSKLLGTPPLYQTAGAFAKRELIMPVKDRLAFMGPGTSRLSNDLARADGSVDALGVGPP